MTTEGITTGPMRDAVATDRTIGGEITIDKTTEVVKTIEGMIIDKGTRMKVEIDQEIIVMTVPEVEKEVEIETDGFNLDPELCQMTRGSRSRSNSRVNTYRDRLWCYRCGEYDHFAQECPNTPTDDEMGHSDSEQASLQMVAQDNLPLNSNGEVEYLNL